MKIALLNIAIILSLSTYGQTAQEYYNSGTDKANKKDFEGSVRDYDRAIRADPKYTDAYFNKGTSELYLKEYKEAISDLDKAIELKPDFLKAYTNRGIAKLKTDDLKGAIADFDAALKIEPGNASSYFMRGQVKLNAGDTKGGCYDLTKANELGDTRAQKFLNQYCGKIASSETVGTQKQSLKLDWPDAEGWKIASNQGDNEKKVIELLRNNETFDNWTEIGTMMVYPMTDPALRNVPVEAKMNIMYEQAKKSCPVAKLTFIEKDENAKYPWIIFKIECGTATPESQVWQIVQGSNEMYVNFRAVKQKNIPDDLKNKWVAFFKTGEVVAQ